MKIAATCPLKVKGIAGVQYGKLVLMILSEISGSLAGGYAPSTVEQEVSVSTCGPQTDTGLF